MATLSVASLVGMILIDRVMGLTKGNEGHCRVQAREKGRMRMGRSLSTYGWAAARGT